MVSHRNRLLSFILEQFMMSSTINQDEEKDEILTDEKIAEYLNFNLMEYKRTGSSVEELALPFQNYTRSDIDQMFEFPYIYVVDPEQFTSNERQQYKVTEQSSFLYIDYSNKKYPCYVTLYFYSMQELIETREKTASSILVPGANMYVIPGDFVEPHRKYLLSANFVNWFKVLWPKGESYEEKLEIHGPSICITSKDPTLPLATDHVPSLKCIHWPKSALNWINRTRLSKWPDQNLINSIVKFGCHVVGKSHPLTTSETETIEWRLSFSIGESLLAKTLSFYQKKCYLIVKALVDVHIKQDLELSKVICTYYLKTILYWLCESIGKEQWTYETLYDRFIDFIDYAITCFEKKCLNHYFIPEMNLIDHLNDEHLKKLSEKCLLIKNDLLNMIKICEEYYWNTNQFRRFDAIIEVLTENENLHDNSCIIWCCAITMQGFIKQYKLIDCPLKIVNDCIKRKYLESCSDESARYLLYFTSLITHLVDDNNEENLSAHNAMIKICEAKSFFDQSYEEMKENYVQIQNCLALKNN